MNDEEMKQEMQTIETRLAELAKPGSTLTKQDKRRRHILTLKKSTLEKLKLAREKDEMSQEHQLLAMYAMLRTAEGKHPLFLILARQRFGTNFF